MTDFFLAFGCGALGGLFVNFVLDMLAAQQNERKNKENDW